MTTTGALREDVPYWTRGERVANFGDLLTVYLMRRALTGPARTGAAVHRIVGSVISAWTIGDDLDDPERARPRCFWGCGARDAAPLDEADHRACAFPAVRGPHTRAMLGLGTDVPMGDPGLLLPLILPRRARGGGGRVLAPHILDRRDRRAMAQATGCDRILEAGIEPTTAAVEAFVETIVCADVVLASSLHAAITACAYGVPYAYWSAGGLVDVPFKWLDFASSVGIPAAFADTFAQAEAASRRLRPEPPALAPLVRSAPFEPSAELLRRAAVHDALGPDPSWEPLPDDDVHMTGAVEADEPAGRDAPVAGRPGLISRLLAHAGR